MTGQMLEKIESILLAEQPDWVIVYGDTNSTLAEPWQQVNYISGCTYRGRITFIQYEYTKINEFSR